VQGTREVTVFGSSLPPRPEDYVSSPWLVRFTKDCSLAEPSWKDWFGLEHAHEEYKHADRQSSGHADQSLLSDSWSKIMTAGACN
jgi:hypothetical protein